MTTAPSSPPEAPSKPVLWRYVVGVVVALFLPFAFWPSLLTKATSSKYLPHRYCYLNNPQLVWSNVVSDSVIAISYVAISATLAVLVNRASERFRSRGCSLPSACSSLLAAALT